MTTISKKIEIDQEVFKVISKIAKDENTTENKIINQVLKKEIEITKKEPLAEKIERLSNGKITVINKDRYNPNATKEELNSIIGIATAPLGFNPVEAVKEVRRGD